MTFGILNLNTSFVLMGILGCTTVLSYFTIVDGLLLGDLIFIAKFFLVIIMLINLFLINFIVLKFRLICITNTSVFICYPFRFLIISSNLKKINGIKWSNYIDTKVIFYRQLFFKTEEGKSITICDKEFENLDSIAKAISKDLMKSKKLKEFNIKRAKTNQSNQFLNVLFAIFLTCAIIYISFKVEIWNDIKLTFIGIILTATILLLISNIRRYLTYKKIMANSC